MGGGDTQGLDTSNWGKTPTSSLLPSPPLPTPPPPLPTPPLLYLPYTSNASLSTGSCQHRITESAPALKHMSPLLLMMMLSTAPQWPLRVCTGSTSTRAFRLGGCDGRGEDGSKCVGKGSERLRIDEGRGEHQRDLPPLKSLEYSKAFTVVSRFPYILYLEPVTPPPPPQPPGQMFPTQKHSGAHSCFITVSFIAVYRGTSLTTHSLTFLSAAEGSRS